MNIDFWIILELDIPRMKSRTAPLLTTSFVEGPSQMSLLNIYQNIYRIWGAGIA
jgi:hypothetical protein